MRFHSSVKSSISMEVSFLAVLESVSSIVLMLWVFLEYNVIIHIIIAISLAPFLLLKNDNSISDGFKVFSFLINELDSSAGFSKESKIWAVIGTTIFSTLVAFLLAIFVSEEIVYHLSGWFLITLFGLIVVCWVAAFTGEKRGKFIFLILRFLSEIIFYPYVVASSILGFFIFGLAFGSVFSKTYVTLKTLIINPISCIREIPRNWFNIVFCVDVFYPPELLPGIENSKYDKTISEFKFKKMIKNYIGVISEEIEWINKMWMIMYLISAIVVFVPSVIYRWSLKSSSIIWMPLIWIVGKNDCTSDEANKRLQSDLKLLRYSAWGKITAFYSSIVIVFMTIIPLVFKERIKLELNNHGGLYHQEVVRNFFDYFLSFQMHSWHWSRLIVSLITLLIFFYADRLLLKRKEFPEFGVNTVPFILRAIEIIRVPLSLFTIGCGVHLFYTSIDWSVQFSNMLWLPVEAEDFISDFLNRFLS